MRYSREGIYINRKINKRIPLNKNISKIDYTTISLFSILIIIVILIKVV